MIQDIDHTRRVRDSIIAMMAEVGGRRLTASAEAAEKSFGALGVDSVSVVQLHLKIEEAFSLSLPDDFLIVNNTPALAAAVIVAHLQNSSPITP